METMEFLSSVWLDYLQGKTSIEAVIAEYRKHGFDANQDLPGNVYWHQLYKALGPDTKVILTVRDNDQQEGLKVFIQLNQKQFPKWFDNLIYSGFRVGAVSWHKSASEMLLVTFVRNH